MKRTTIALLSLLLLFSSCVSYTQLIATNDRADIYVNGVYKGKGTAKIKRNGAPKRALITAKIGSREVGNITIRRKHDLVSLIVGYYTFGWGWIFYLHYPESVVIPIEAPSQDGQYISPWDTKPGSWED